MRRTAKVTLGLARYAIIIAVVTSSAMAQELEPRAYSPSPVGTTFVVAAFGNSNGDITFDPAIPITNVQANFYSTVLGGGQTFGLFGRQSLITVGLPYVWGDVSGQVNEQAGSITRSGLADMKIRFAFNLRGSPALTPREFATIRRRTWILGTSLSINAPTGQYDPAKLINLGTNRWAFKPELGVSYPWRKFDLDFYAGAWFYTDNSSFFPGKSVRTQDVLTAAQAHASYTFRRNLWVAIDSTWYGGGATQINGGKPSERQSNSRLGATLSIPLAKQQSIKVSYSSGVTANTGASFRTIGVAWQYAWFDRK